MNDDQSEQCVRTFLDAFYAGDVARAQDCCDDDISSLRKLWAEGVPVRKLALRFRRSQSAIRGKAVQLGLKRPVQPSHLPIEGEIRAH